MAWHVGISDRQFGTLPIAIFFVKFGLKTPRYILGTIFVNFEICKFLGTPGLFEYFSKNGCFQKMEIFLMKEQEVFHITFFSV